MQLANEYLDGAALAGVGGSSLPENVGAKVEEVCTNPKPSQLQPPRLLTGPRKTMSPRSRSCARTVK